MIHLQTIERLSLELLQPLLDASLREGYTFIQKLWDEYESGAVPFTEPGALLLGGFVDSQLAAVGGVHPDPYLNVPTIGRIRHVYVQPQLRRHGVGALLVQALMAQSAAHFTTFTLRTMTEHGCAFYEALGFSAQPRFAQASHWRSIANPE